MELIKSVAQRNTISEVGHVLLNLLYAGLLLVMVLSFDMPYLAFGIVLLSKWRVFAVRPRFWLANIQTNLLDTVMGLSVATLLWQSAGSLTVQLAVAALFALWLIVLKPSSKHFWVVTQGAVTQAVAMSALFMVAHTLPITVVVSIGGLVGYIVARHIINVYHEEREDVVVSLAWALIVAELSWLTYHWTVAYTSLKITQVAIVVTLLGYMTLLVYNAMYHRERGSTVRRELVMPVAFSLIGIVLVLVFFNFFDPTSL